VRVADARHKDRPVFHRVLRDVDILAGDIKPVQPEIHPVEPVKRVHRRDVCPVCPEAVDASAVGVIDENETRAVEPAEAEVQAVREVKILQGKIAVLEIEKKVRGKNDLVVASRSLNATTVDPVTP